MSIRPLRFVNNYYIKNSMRIGRELVITTETLDYSVQIAPLFQYMPKHVQAPPPTTGNFYKITSTCVHLPIYYITVFKSGCCTC